MATLTPLELTAVRQEFAAANNASPVTWTKPQINAASQAVEDILSAPSLATALSNAIDTALSPVSINATAKRRLVAILLRLKFQRDKV